MDITNVAICQIENGFYKPLTKLEIDYPLDSGVTLDLNEEACNELTTHRQN